MKKLAILILTCLLALALVLPMAAPAMASSIATFGADPSDWQKTVNRIVQNTIDGLNNAPAWDDAAWDGWTSPAWDGPEDGIYGDPIPGYVVNDTWVEWSNAGTDWIQHTDQWFRTTVDIPSNWNVTAAKLVYKYDHGQNFIPINDDLYVYVDDQYVAAGGTATDSAVQTHIPVLPPNPTYGSNTFIPAVLDFGTAPETGWYISYIDGGLDLPPELFTPGSHDIHVLGEEFDESGGLGHLVINVTYEITTTTETKLIRHKKSCFMGLGFFGKLPCSGKVPSITLGQSVQDKATVTGTDSAAPTGNVQFQVSADDGATWNTYSTNALTAVSSTIATAISDSYIPPAAGNYLFRAVYDGDDNYDGSQSGDTAEPLKVCKAPTFARTQLSARTITLGDSVTDKITISTLAKGTLPEANGTWTLQASKYFGFNKNVVEVDSGAVIGNLPFVVTSNPFIPDSAGVWYFRVIYRDDDNYANTQNCLPEVLRVTNGVTNSCPPPHLPQLPHLPQPPFSPFHH